MSIFPKRTGATGAEPRASASPEGANAQSAGAGAAALAANSTEQKDHRFDKFARKIGDTMIEAIRVTLSVFSSPDKERWPATKLLDYLKGAEELAREMLREIAEKIFVYPPAERASVGMERSLRPESAGVTRAPYFRLGVKREKEKLDENTSHRHPPTCSADLPPQDAQLDDGGPGLAQSANRNDDTSNESLYQRRITALQDVLTHPGKHAARMARAIYRAAHEDGDRLIARSYNELMLDHGNFLASDPAYAGSEAARRMQQLFIDPG